MFLDSDDYIKEDMIEKMLKTILEKDVDFVQSGFIYKYENFEKEVYLQEHKYSGTIKYNYFNSSKTFIPVWNKLYNYQSIKDLIFKEGYNFEDIIYTYDLFNCCKSYYNISEAFYYYVQREKSIMHDKSINNLFKPIKSIDVILEKALKSNDLLLIQLCYYKKYRTLIDLYRSLKHIKKIEIKELKEIRRQFSYIKVRRYISLKDKIVTLISFFSYRLLFFLLNIKDR